MSEAWIFKETTTYQDHVIAHVMDALILGHFVFDEAAYIVLDIGFVWTIFIDGQMALLPQMVAIDDLDTTDEMKTELKRELDSLTSGRLGAKLTRVSPASAHCVITDVELLEAGNQMRLIIKGEAARVIIDASIKRCDISVRYES